ncbi:M23 family metallopeptidase [Pseudoalteromonas sp. MMG013]|uniref:M23 family metallopeptidase n=1 Tax=Pseudoalteromonas sp. MMG013 TaxID=2822687 RepID=UPI001B366EEC|nr:M23 family metallopeptidase [Pseudoalteromonas sp. MMG013]MBQ4862369.1 M23 family metallopeptidase [Pseudoalteromonas sp. MMG013]
MKSTLYLSLLTLPMIGFVQAQGQHHLIDELSSKQTALIQATVNSVIAIDENEFVFNNALQNEDWNDFFYRHAPHLLEFKAVILHWAGHASINPKLLLALMELQSSVLSEPSKSNIMLPFGTLSNKAGFAEQVQDLAITLNQRFYEYAQKVEGKVRSSPTNSATSSLISVLIKTQLKPYGSLNKLVGIYETLSNVPLLLSQNKTPAASLNPSNSFYMSFPWPSGYAWYSGGAHSNTGSGYPYSSLDFNNGSGGWGSNTPWVQAAHGGTVTRYSSCNIRVTHSSGYATQYYHMSNLQYRSGDVINSGAWLGRYANNKNQALCQGGQSSGPHVHFSLLNNGRFTSLHNWYISNYRIDVGNSNYDDNCRNFYFEKNGYKTCAWRALYK